MKIFASSLFCFVLVATQCFAIPGGPDYGQRGSLIGTFAGIMQGPANAIGIFTLGVPKTGFTTGQFVIFTKGLFLRGDAQGIADGNQRKITALLHAEAILTTVFAGMTNTSIVAVADGQMTASVGSSSVGSGTLTGTAIINEHDPNDTMSSQPDESYQVTGFKQSSIPPS